MNIIHKIGLTNIHYWYDVNEMIAVAEVDENWSQLAGRTLWKVRYYGSCYRGNAFSGVEIVCFCNLKRLEAQILKDFPAASIIKFISP